MASEPVFEASEWLIEDDSSGEDGIYRLRLYVTGSTPKSLRAIANLKQICEEHLQGKYELEVIDLYENPHLAVEDQIVAAPTLVKELPSPLCRMIGDMSDIDRILIRLELGPQRKQQD